MRFDEGNVDRIRRMGFRSSGWPSQEEAALHSMKWMGGCIT